VEQGSLFLTQETRVNSSSPHVSLKDHRHCNTHHVLAKNGNRLDRGSTKLWHLPAKQASCSLWEHLVTYPIPCHGKSPLVISSSASRFAALLESCWVLLRLHDWDQNAQHLAHIHTNYKQLKQVFTLHDVPAAVTLISDNGPNYASTEFSMLTKLWDFPHITISPRYHKSNGKAELWSPSS